MQTPPTAVKPTMPSTDWMDACAHETRRKFSDMKAAALRIEDEMLRSAQSLLWLRNAL